jgi:LTXXQ motif family protein
MKSLITTIVAGSLAVSLGAGAAAAAPTAQNSATGSPAAGTGQMAGVRAVIQDARIEGMKAALKLTPDQERYWTPFQAALRDSYKLHNQIRGSTRQAIATDDPVQLLDKLSGDASQGAAQIKKVADAAKPLYDSLNPDQKRTFGPLLLTLRSNPMATATRAQHVRQMLMQRWARSESKTGD